MELTKEQFDNAIATLATKADLTHLATTDEVTAVKDELSAMKVEMSGLATSSELLSLKFDLHELKGLVFKIDKRDQEDSNAFLSTLVDHGMRISKIEKVTGIKALARSTE